MILLCVGAVTVCVDPQNFYMVERFSTLLFYDCVMCRCSHSVHLFYDFVMRRCGHGMRQFYDFAMRRCDHGMRLLYDFVMLRCDHGMRLLYDFAMRRCGHGMHLFLWFCYAYVRSRYVSVFMILLCVGAVTVCVDPQNFYMDERCTFPTLLDSCAQGWVNNIVFTSSLSPQVGRVNASQSLMMSSNNLINVVIVFCVKKRTTLHVICFNIIQHLQNLI